MQEPKVRRATFQERHAEREKLRLEQKYRTAEASQKPSDQGQTGDTSLDLEKSAASDPKKLKNIAEELHESDTPFDIANSSSNWSNQDLDSSMNNSQLNNS